MRLSSPFRSENLMPAGPRGAGAVASRNHVLGRSLHTPRTRAGRTPPGTALQRLSWRIYTSRPRCRSRIAIRGPVLQACAQSRCRHAQVSSSAAAGRVRFVSSGGAFEHHRRPCRCAARADLRMPGTVAAGGAILGLATGGPNCRRGTGENILRIGKIRIGSLGEWTPTAGSVISWHPTDAAVEKARQAPLNTVPVSYMQGQHLRNYHERTAAGLDFSRQIIATCEVPGRCDIPAMNHAVNAYLRRHDTFHSWFDHIGNGNFVRHTLSDPADIEFTPIDHGALTVEEIRAHVIGIPNPLEWACFTFGIIQNDGHFTFFAAMDHVHGDATLIGT